MEQVVKIICLFWLAVVIAAIVEVIKVDIESLKEKEEEGFDYK